MKHKLLIMFLCLIVSIFSYAQVANPPLPIELCDDEVNNGFALFDLTIRDAEVLGSQNPADYTVTYHETQSDANDGFNALSANSYVNTTNPQTIFVRLEENSSGNFDTTTLTLVVLPNPSGAIGAPADLELCDDLSSDEIEVFDLTLNEALINPSGEVFNITYHLTESDALLGISTIGNPENFTNITNQQTIYVRVEDSFTGCFTLTNFNLIVNPLPVAISPTPLELCDDNNDGMAIFDLTLKNLEILAGDPNSVVTYYETNANAQAQVDPIADPTQYINISSPQTIYASVTDVITGCYTVVDFDLVVATLPIAIQPAPLEQCDDNSDGFVTFDLSTKIDEISNGQPDVEVTFYETLVNAELDVNAIASPMYTNIIAYIQTIYVRVGNNFSDCTSIVTLDLIVNPLPEAVALTDFIACELNTDGFFNFDLTVKDAEVLNGQNPILFNVSYYASQIDADSETNALISPYINTSNPQTIFVRIEDVITGCHVSQTFNLEVNEAAEANADGIPIIFEVCDDNIDLDVDPLNDSAAFDLNILDVEVLDGQDPASYIVNYFASAADANLGVNPLPVLYENIINPQVIYARVDNDTQNGMGMATSVCYAVTEITLQVNPLPNVSVGNVSFCQGDSAILDTGLSASDYSFEWFLEGFILIDETAPFITINQPGEYGVLVLDLASNCSSYEIINVVDIVCDDADSDGVIDSDEDLNGNGNLNDDDTDGDGIPNYLDDDDDGDNVNTTIEINITTTRNNTSHPFVDTDTDNIENYLDDDDDGDDVLTIDEDYNSNGDPTDDDTNGNMIPDYLDNQVALSIVDFEDFSYRLFPNPANSEVTIRFNSGFYQSFDVNLYDSLGKNVMGLQTTNSETINLDISKLEPGLYFVQIKSETSSVVQKLIVE